MAKQIYKLNQFHGGLNNSSSARDLDETEFVDLVDVMVDEIGQIRMMGGLAEHVSTSGSVSGELNSITVNPGKGLFAFSSDYKGADGTVADGESATNYILVQDNDDAVDFAIFQDNGTDTWTDTNIALGGATANDISIFNVDGALRISDGGGTANNVNKWFGYLDHKFYQVEAGTPEATLASWEAISQKLAAFSDLPVTLALHNSQTEGPGNNDIDPSDSNDTTSKLTVSYWTAEDGQWNGRYDIGVAPVYDNNQEGPIDKIDAIQLNNHILNIQLYISHMDSDNGTITSNQLKDNRIVGVKVYSKAYTSEQWFLLKHFNLLDGGKHGWLQYDADTDSAKDYWDDSGTRHVKFDDSDGDGTSELTQPGSSTQSTTYYESHTLSRANFKVQANTAFSANRRFVLRVTGFNVSPVYSTEFAISNTNEQSISIEVMNPAAGTANFTIDLLDENFNIVVSNQQTLTITDSGKVAPVEPDDGGYGGSS